MEKSHGPDPASTAATLIGFRTIAYALAHRLRGRSDFLLMARFDHRMIITRLFKWCLFSSRKIHVFGGLKRYPQLFIRRLTPLQVGGKRSGSLSLSTEKMRLMTIFVNLRERRVD